MAVLSLAALALGTSTISGAAESNLDPALCAPGRNDFTSTVDNRYFPLPVGRQKVLAGRDQGESLGFQITVFDTTESFFRGGKRVTTRVVEEREWADRNGNARIDPREDPIEVSQNYFAQTGDGTVCYFGEAVDIYEGGVVVSHDGSWRADTRGHAPGIFMPETPRVGMTFQQEIAPGIAEDMATIVADDRRTKVPAGTFTETITVRDVNPLDGSISRKVYAEDVGLIVDRPLKLVRR